MTDTSPANTATGVALDADSQATFSEAMDPATITSGSFTLVKASDNSPVAAAVTYDANTKTAILNPASDLAPDSTYTATVATAVKDSAGNPLASAKTWGFTTAVQGTSSAPLNTSAPTISGTPQSGQTLTANPGSWSGTQPITYAYQWQRCNSSGSGCGAISGATNSTYTATGADVGSTLRVAVTATNTVGSVTATSNPTTVVQAGSVQADRSSATGSSRRLLGLESGPDGRRRDGDRPERDRQQRRARRPALGELERGVEVLRAKDLQRRPAGPDRERRLPGAPAGGERR